MSRPASISFRALCIIAVLVSAYMVLAPSKSASAQPLLGLSKTVSNASTGGAAGMTATASPGQTLLYTLTYSNTGTAAAPPASPLTITDVVQAGQTFTGVCTVTTPGATCIYSAPTLTITVPSLASGASGTATFSTTVNPGFSGTIANQATATAPGAATVTSNATTVTVGVGASILSLSKAVVDVTRGGGPTSSIFASPGDQIQYQLTLTNTSSTTSATGVTVTDVIQGFQNIASTGFVCGPVGTSCTLSGSTVTWNVGTLAPGASTVLTFNVFISRSAINGQQIYDQGTACATNASCVNSNVTTVEVSSGVVVTPPCGYACTTPCTTACTSPCGYFTCAAPCAYASCTAPCSYASCATPCGYTACSTPCGYASCTAPCGYTGCAAPCGYASCTTPCGYTACTAPCGYTACASPCATACAAPCGYTACAPYAANVVCGNVVGYNPATATTGGTVTMNGNTYQIVAGTSFAGTVVAPGYASCFLLGPQSYITGCLSSIPVAAIAAEKPIETRRVGYAKVF